MDQEFRIQSGAVCEAKDEETHGSWHFHFQEIGYMLSVGMRANLRLKLTPEH